MEHNQAARLQHFHHRVNLPEGRVSLSGGRAAKLHFHAAERAPGGQCHCEAGRQELHANFVQEFLGNLHYA